MTGPRLPRARVAAAFAVTLLGLPALTAAAHAAGFALADGVLVFLAAVVGVALLGGLWPALLAAVGGFLLLNYFFTAPVRSLDVNTGRGAFALAMFVLVALEVSWVVDLAARRARQAAAAAAEARVLAARQQRLVIAAEGDRVRTALLAAVSHDLRTPLAAAKAAVAGLRSDEVTFDEEDRRELLETADESLDRLGALLANLLDMSRLQAGALAVHPVALGLEDVVPSALDELGPPARSITVRLPDDLPAATADPGLLDRVLVNVVGNALRHSPADRPPEITGRAAGGRLELHVIDHGPGIAPGDRERAFQAFQRLGDRDNHTGVGLGLALSRGLTEAMGGTLTPEETPGGGLTMVLTLPIGLS